MPRRASRRIATYKGVCGHVCYAWPQTLLDGEKAVHCLYCEKWVAIQDESLVLRRVPIPRPKKYPPHPGQQEIPF